MDDQQEETLVDTLKGIAQGRFVEEATDQMRTLVKEMNRVASIGGGKPKGKLVITLNLTLDRNVFDLEPSIRVTTPAAVRARTVMFSTADGRLLKQAPPSPQQQLALGEGQRDVKDVSTRADVRDIRERQANDR